MKHSEESDATRLKQKFGAGSQYTKVFESFDKSIQSFLLKRAELEVGEHPILAHYQPLVNWISKLELQLLGKSHAINWLLLTTRRLLWCNPDKNFYEMRHENIESVGWSSGPDGWPGRDLSSPPDTLVLTDLGKGHCKHYSPWLHIIDASGIRYELFLEPGKCLIALRNTIWQLSGGWYKAAARAEQANKESADNCPNEAGSDAYKARRFEKEIYKHGEHYASNLFTSLAPTTREFLLVEAALDEDEIPVFAFFENEETWFAATTRKVFWSRPGVKHRLRYCQIKEIGLSEMKKLGPAKELDDREERRTQIGLIKSSSPWLYFVDEAGEQHDALVPPGGPLFMIWNTIRLMVRLEMIHPTEQSKS